MLYTLLCYNDEATTTAWTAEEDAAVMARLPATSHTAVITQPELLRAFIEPFLAGETPKGMFEQ